MARPHIEPFCDQDVHFKKMTLPGMPNGMHYKMLSIDPDTGACTMTVRFDAGFKAPPGFSLAETELLIMEGQLTVGDTTYWPGLYLFIPPGVAMPPMSSKDGCVGLLMYNDGPPSFVPSDEDAGGAERHKLLTIESFDRMPWQVPNLFPQTASGCLIKVLRMDEKTHALSFLYSMVPGFWQDNISYHDVAEEAYHIYGTSWMMQFGDLPGGGYFYRPPYINHGAFASKGGVLAFGRTDGELHNHFHFNPYTEPEENRQRAQVKVVRAKPALNTWFVSADHNHITPLDFEDFQTEDDWHTKFHHHGHDHSHD